MSLSGKITTISCRIDLRAIEPVSNSLIFRPLHHRVVRFMLRKDSISSNLAITRLKWVIDVMYVITKEEKASQSLNSV